MSVSPPFTILAPRAVLPGHAEVVPATIEVDAAGKIAAVREGLVATEGPVLRVPEGKVLLPGLIDLINHSTHVHLNQPGRTAWEGFATGTSAAVSGGVTTLIDMPLNSIPPTTTVANLETKRGAARDTGIACDVGFWGGIIPGNAGDLAALVTAGVKGFKCFLIHSGVDEFPHVVEADLVAACGALEPGALVMFHAELDAHAHESETTGGGDPAAYSTFLASRPPSLETDALTLILTLARRFPALRFHIVHLSASDALPALSAARAGTDGGPPVSNLTVETCFHYLTLSAEDVPPNATQYKCCPPIRSAANRAALVAALHRGEIDYVVSDHSPCTPELKRGDFMSAWGGVSGLGLGLQLLWTEMPDAGLGRIVGWLGARQARQVGLEGRKGEIVQGADADFVMFDPDASVQVSTESLRFRNKLSPYVGRTLKGTVEQTYLRGKLVFDNGTLVDAAHGTLL